MAVESVKKNGVTYAVQTPFSGLAPYGVKGPELMMSFEGGRPSMVATGSDVFNSMACQIVEKACKTMDGSGGLHDVYMTVGAMKAGDFFSSDFQKFNGPGSRPIAVNEGKKITPDNITHYQYGGTIAEPKARVQVVAVMWGIAPDVAQDGGEEDKVLLPKGIAEPTDAQRPEVNVGDDTTKAKWKVLKVGAVTGGMYHITVE